ncbi:PD-(D/E)XK nuclease family protein [Methylobacterium oxalidis]|uniref:PD-(D/E)XK nuclease family protein n=1 Tax=Methylobacterium oxalidis TaxID=944322 RepID=UPI003314CB1F
MPARRTLVLQGRLATREAKLEAARGGCHGVQLLTFEQLATRVAGGFVSSIDADTLRQAVRELLPVTPLGELDPIKMLPGMAGAAAETLYKVWRAGINLQSRSSEHGRISSLAVLERAVLERLPSSMLRPIDIVEVALNRLSHAPTILGPVEISGLTELSPCWRPLLLALPSHVPVVWRAGPRAVPAWLHDSNVVVELSEPATPTVTVVSAATALHEAVEALRWARELIATGRARPSEIGIAACRTADYDEAFLALRAEANLSFRFVHGIPAATTRDGQAAAALADLLVRGLSQNGVRRLFGLVRNLPGLFKNLPDDWTRVLPRDAPLADKMAWLRLLEKVEPNAFSDGKDHRSALQKIIEVLAGGTDGASAAGEQILCGPALRIWRKALAEAPASALDGSIRNVKFEDGHDACATLAWMPAAALAASPRPFVRLLGLSSRGWPQQASEDCLLPDHVIPAEDLDPLPVSAADRRDFATILSTAAREVVLSRPRRDAEGRLIGRSPLLHPYATEDYLRRNRIAPHAMSEGDRLFARPREFGETDGAKASLACWRNWNCPELTSHDGLLRQDHPVIRQILQRRYSATSLRKLLRDPAGFVWKYGMGLRAPSRAEDPLVLEANAFGNFLHVVLEETVVSLETTTGLAAAGAAAIQEAVGDIIDLARGRWEEAQPVPPPVIWKRTVSEVADVAVSALKHPDEPLPGQRSYVEVPFGGLESKRDGASLPWDPMQPVTIPGTKIQLSGFIDRLDLAEDGSTARVRDYKSGKPLSANAILNQG